MIQVHFWILLVVSIEEDGAENISKHHTRVSLLKLQYQSCSLQCSLLLDNHNLHALTQELLALPYPSHFLCKEPKQDSMCVNPMSSISSAGSTAQPDDARKASINPSASAPSTPTHKDKLGPREDSAEAGTLAPLAAWCRV